MFARLKSGISSEAGLSKLRFTTLSECYMKELNLSITHCLLPQVGSLRNWYEFPPLHVKVLSPESPKPSKHSTETVEPDSTGNIVSVFMLVQDCFRLVQPEEMYHAFAT